ncbi:Malectin-A [Gracilariopsis chorda]|uniref:Malectin-A n=1 Tax=Gracilariopsis chorda TaxID=448386 RepID=A0A2V3IZI0_9FLOR|nr:Malectin-A [Gracilariopsis chorda]|eukprot:PXF47087.1 Malectin-A [Gracilariopsis chorda]
MTATRPSPTPIISLLISSSLFLLLSVAAAAPLRINCGGDALQSIAFREDLPAYVSPENSIPLSIPKGTVQASGTWQPVYDSYRYAPSGNLQYKIPVPSATYTVALMFAETYAPLFKKGARIFSVLINGVNKLDALDVFATSGSNNALFLSFGNISPVAGFITITLARIPGKENPMISAIVINAPNADQLVSQSSPPPPTQPPVTPTLTTDPTCSNGIFASNPVTKQMACCPSACGQCGGNGCGNFAPGQLCCISSINIAAKSCDTDVAPCVPSKDLSAVIPNPAPAPTTTPSSSPNQCPAGGILGENPFTSLSACCKSVCGKCGGNNCGNFAAGELCCISSINSLGKSCSSNPPPCVPDGLVTKVDTAPVPPPSTADNGLACTVSGATENQFRMNAAGPQVEAALVGADNKQYISSTSVGEAFNSDIPVSGPSGPAPWDTVYSSHRWTKESVLSYKIPVPAGTFTVKLLFAEVYFSAVGLRTFDVFINGATKEQNLDIFKAVGKNVGLVKTYNGVPSKNGFIDVTLIKAVENPMISGIFIEGPGAGSKAVGGGCVLGATGKAFAGDLNNGFDHRSHSVPGGPYIATDFNNDGVATVALDGTQSHSHYSDPGPPEVSGAIVAYKWTWQVMENGVLVQKVNTNKSGKFSASFPLGKTTITLEVVDTTGDVAMESTEVEVKSSTTNGAYCYFYDYGAKSFATVPLPAGLNSFPKPLFGDVKPTISMNNAAAFGNFPFSQNAFAVRCIYFVEIPKTGVYSFKVQHNGPFKLYYAGAILAQSNSMGVTTTPDKYYMQKLHSFQITYFRPKNLTPVLVLTSPELELTKSVLQHDSGNVLPIITGLSKSESTPSGGENIQIFGSAFINGVSVKFGNKLASNLISSDPGVLQVTVPEGFGSVPITVNTNAGVSNAVTFTYISGTTLNQPVIFTQTKLKDLDGSDFKVSFIAGITYGPDGRLYMGSSKGNLYALAVDKNFQVTKKCIRSAGPSHRAVLGVAFSPFSNQLKMYFTTSSMYWKNENIFPFEEGWTNGKIQSIDFSPTMLSDEPGKPCAGSPQDVVTGLPVSNHDHGINKLQFLPTGELIVGIGGFTNGGVSIPGKKPVPGDAPDDLLGGVASNPLSAALVSCPYDKVTNIKYDQYVDPEKSKIISGQCKVYASGLRNTFGMTVHTNGKLYATDNGPNKNFGDFSTNCFGGSKSSGSMPSVLKDKLYLIEPGKYHGHPNLNRKECVPYPPSAVQPLISNLQSSSNGIVEYRSNTFGGAIKGDLFISKFTGQHEGRVSQVKVGSNGKNIGYAPIFLGFSGLNVVEGPRGEFIMPRVYKSEVVIAKPSYPAPAVTFLLGVHPKQGPAMGGTKVLITGHNFGFTPQATFGGKACTNIDVHDDDSFTCITPPNPKNTQVSVKVVGSAGTSPSYGSDYWYM